MLQVNLPQGQGLGSWPEELPTAALEIQLRVAPDPFQLLAEPPWSHSSSGESDGMVGKHLARPNGKADHPDSASDIVVHFKYCEN